MCCVGGSVRKREKKCEDYGLIHWIKAKMNGSVKRRFMFVINYSGLVFRYLRGLKKLVGTIKSKWNELNCLR